MFDVLIIGGGVSGISCSLWVLQKANRSPLVKKLESSRIKLPHFKKLF
jgi:anaerobic glycerol-3-phosphate dehydrogenase